MHKELIQAYTQLFQKHSWNRKDLITELFQNTELKDTYPNEIRRATIVGKIANEVLTCA